MSSVAKFKPAADFVAKAHIKSLDDYKKLYDESIKNPDAFWTKMAEDLHWYKKWDKVVDYDFHKGEIKWFAGGKTNVSYNCLDRHVLAGHGDKTALIWEGNDPSE